MFFCVALSAIEFRSMPTLAHAASERAETFGVTEPLEKRKQRSLKANRRTDQTHLLDASCSMCVKGVYHKP